LWAEFEHELLDALRVNTNLRARVGDGTVVEANVDADPNIDADTDAEERSTSSLLHLPRLPRLPSLLPSTFPLPPASAAELTSQISLLSALIRVRSADSHSTPVSLLARS
jgi:hypothetical protein